MSKSRGSVSVYALLTMMVLLTASLGVGALAIGSLGRAEKEKKAIASFEAGQAGLEWTVTQGFQDLDLNNGFFVSTQYDLDDVVAPIAPGASAWGRIDPNPDATYAWITASATADGSTRSMRTLVTARNVGIWNNAIFAGTGASGQAINGNVDIRGSVHILGDGEEFSDLNNNGQWDGAEPYTDKNKNGVWDPGEAWVDVNGDGVRNLAEPYNDTNQNGIYDPPLTQTDLNSDLSGNAHIGNNYAGMPVGLEAMVPPPPKPGGIENLTTEVRVKHGQIGVSGSATIGDLGVVDGGTSKGTIEGSYVSDGWTGNQGANQVYSDNGTSNGYDLNNLGIDFPLLSGIGANPYLDKATGVTYPTQENYLDTRSMLVVMPTITAATSSFSFGPDAKGNKVSWNKATGILDIQGVVKVVGDIQIGAKDTIRYTGNGTIYSTDNIRIDGNFVPAAGVVFPTTARVGLIAKENMYLAGGNGSSQLTMAGAFYAQGTIVSRKQNQIAGTFVANFYDMGTNVPNIYQVPALPQNMPPAMPGDKNYYTLKVRSWRQRDSSSLRK
jgi:hypothetical protein